MGRKTKETYYRKYFEGKKLNEVVFGLQVVVSCETGVNLFHNCFFCKSVGVSMSVQLTHIVAYLEKSNVSGSVASDRSFPAGFCFSCRIFVL